MQKYYYYLLKLKEYVKNEFNIEILLNISKYPLNNDTSLLDYYKKIAHEIKKVEIGSKNKLDKARYYIEKTKPFEFDGNIYYEITLSTATDKMNKFDRMIAYTEYDILPNYAITISIVEKEISLFSSKKEISSLGILEYSSYGRYFNSSSTSVYAAAYLDLVIYFSSYVYLFDYTLKYLNCK